VVCLSLSVSAYVCVGVCVCVCVRVWVVLGSRTTNLRPMCKPVSPHSMSPRWRMRLHRCSRMPSRASTTSLISRLMWWPYWMKLPRSMLWLFPMETQPPRPQKCPKVTPAAVQPPWTVAMRPR